MRKKSEKSAGLLESPDTLESSGDAGKPDINSGESAEQAKLSNDEKRVERSRATAHSLFIWGLRFLFWIAMSILGIRAWHLIGPDSWIWLAEDKLNTIDKILGAAAGGGLVGKYLRNIFPEKSP